MKSKCGLGVLLLAALLSALAIWFLPVSSAAADILLFITGGTVSHITSPTEAYEIHTYGRPPSLKSVPLQETNTPHVSDIVTNVEENNLTLSGATPDISSTRSLETSRITVDLTSDTGRITGAELNNYTHFYPSLYFVDKQSVTPDITSDMMETDKAVCPSGPNKAEVLAIAIGAVFLTIILSALLYQFSVFMRNKKAQRDSSVFVIENELHKYDVEANGLEPETKL